MKNDWRNEHKATIQNFLKYLNRKTDRYILKGGTALMECYGLDRFSEDIDLDSTDHNTISSIVDRFCMDKGYKYRTAKDTDTVKRYFINYGNDEKPLKVEISYRQKEIRTDFCTNINGINVYSLDRLARMKCAAYSGRDKIRDLYDVCFITNRYLNDLSLDTQDQIRISLEAKGIEQFDYIISTQKDELVDVDKLADDVLSAFDSLGLLASASDFTSAVMSISNDGEEQKL